MHNNAFPRSSELPVAATLLYPLLDKPCPRGTKDIHSNEFACCNAPNRTVPLFLRHKKMNRFSSPRLHLARGRGCVSMLHRVRDRSWIRLWLNKFRGNVLVSIWRKHRPGLADCAENNLTWQQCTKHLSL
jgi:hypothetical protein